MSWRVVLFDLDGTLVDSVDLILASYRHVLRRFGRSGIPDEEIRTWIGVPLEHSFRALDPTHWESMQAEYRSWNIAHHDGAISACDGVAGLLTDLATAGVATGVVTSKARGLAQHGLALCGLNLPLVTAMEDTLVHKPSAAPLLHALDTGRWSAEDAVYVGDAATDLQAATAAGMASIGVTWGAGVRAALKAEGPVAVVDNAEQLSAALGLSTQGAAQP